MKFPQLFAIATALGTLLIIFWISIPKTRSNGKLPRLPSVGVQVNVPYTAQSEPQSVNTSDTQHSSVNCSGSLCAVANHTKSRTDTDNSSLLPNRNISQALTQSLSGAKADEVLTIKKYKSLMKGSAISKDVVIHRVYFDDRRKRGHKNQTVFFIDANWTIFKHDWIVGCGVNDQRAKEHRIRIAAEWYWVRGSRRKVPFKYEHLYVDCYDLPAKNGDRAFLIYKTRNSSKEIVVESDYPMIFPKPRLVPPNDGYNVTVVVCVKANSKIIPFLGEILHYQKLIGVDHVSLITLSSFVKDGGLIGLIKKYPYILKYFTDGFISVDLWKVWHDETKKAHEIRLWTESIRKVACAYNYRGTYEYAMPIDSDDFFTPRIKDKPNIKYYINTYCHGPQIGSCMLKWITYYPDFCGLSDIPSDGNVTKALKSHSLKMERSPKSIHKTSVLLDATFHDAQRRFKDPTMVEGYEIVKVDHTICAVSHMRMFAKPKFKKCDKI